MPPTFPFVLVRPAPAGLFEVDGIADVEDLTLVARVDVAGGMNSEAVLDQLRAAYPWVECLSSVGVWRRIHRGDHSNPHTKDLRTAALSVGMDLDVYVPALHGVPPSNTAPTEPRWGKPTEDAHKAAAEYVASINAEPALLASVLHSDKMQVQVVARRNPDGRRLVLNTSGTGTLHDAPGRVRKGFLAPVHKMPSPAVARQAAHEYLVQERDPETWNADRTKL